MDDTLQTTTTFSFDGYRIANTRVFAASWYDRQL